MKNRGNRSILIGFVLIGVASVMLYLLLVASRPAQITVVVPARDIQPFELIDGGDFEQVKVTKDSSAYGARVLTATELAAKLKSGKKSRPVFATAALLKGALVDERVLGTDVTGSFAVVGPGELAVAVKTSRAGSVAGAALPGSVVIATSDENSVNAKVICVGTCSAVGSAVAGGTANKNSTDSSSSELVVLLAVPAEQASGIAGREVNLALNPHCRVIDDGSLLAVDDVYADECNALTGSAGAKSGAKDADGPSVS